MVAKNSWGAVACQPSEVVVWVPPVLTSQPVAPIGLRIGDPLILTDVLPREEKRGGRQVECDAQLDDEQDHRDECRQVRACGDESEWNGLLTGGDGQPQPAGSDARLPAVPWSGHASVAGSPVPPWPQ